MTREEQIIKIGAQFAIDETDGQTSGRAASMRGVLLSAFRAGAQWADSYPNWISVEDELPEKENEFEDYSKLVVVTDGKDFYKGMYNYGGECWLTHDLWPIEDATYWMEVQLPQPPRKEE